jgi:hypothetical protein
MLVLNPACKFILCLFLIVLDCIVAPAIEKLGGLKLFFAFSHVLVDAEREELSQF